MTIGSYTKYQSLSEEEIIQHAFEIEKGNGNYLGLTVDEFEKQVAEQVWWFD